MAIHVISVHSFKAKNKAKFYRRGLFQAQQNPRKKER